MKILPLFFFIFILSTTGYSKEVTYYIDNVRGNDAFTGSKDKPWKTSRNIEKLKFNEDIVVLFSKGQIFKESFRVEGNKRKLTFSSYGNGSDPVFDGELLRNSGIEIVKSKNVTVKNLSFKNHIGKGSIFIDYSSDITIDQCFFFVTGHGGVFIQRSTKSIISNNKVITPSNEFNAQTDGMYSQRNSNITFEWNNIVISNQHPDHHCDGIQSYLDTSLIFKGNYIEQDNFKKKHAQGLYITNGAGVFLAYNNIIKCPETKSSVLGFRNLKNGTGSLKAYNNTLIGKGSNLLYISEDANYEIKNNIFYSLSNDNFIHLQNAAFFPENIDYNAYNRSGNPVVVEFTDDKGRKKETWQQLGYDKNSIFEDFELDDEYKPKNKKLKGRGTNLSDVFSNDHKKRTRDRDFDIGAVEID